LLLCNLLEASRDESVNQTNTPPCVCVPIFRLGKPHKSWRRTFAVILRPYQQDLFDRIQSAVRDGVKNPLVVSPTGSGKTALFCYIAHRASQANNDVLILVHRSELITQTSATLDKYGVGHGIIQPSITPSPHHKVQLAMVQTVARRLTKITPPRLIIVDECFPAGTLIGDKKIETIKKGDYVESYNHKHGTVEKKQVLTLFSKEYKGDWYLLTDDEGTKFVCTEEHPVYTEEFEYLPIKDLQSRVNNAKLAHADLPTLRKRKNVRQIQQKSRLSILLKEMSWRLQEATYGFIAIASNELSFLWGASCFCHKENGTTRKKKRESILLTRMRKKIFFKNIIRNDEKNEFEIQRFDFNEDDTKKPHARSEDIAKDDNFQRRKNIFISWWERGAYKTAVEITRSDRLPNGAPNSYKRLNLSKLASLLQSGLGYCGFENSNRSGRENPSTQKMEVFRQKENGDTERVRLESIEVYKRGSGSRPGWVPKENRVYNIHVEGNNNYFANGILVHNCHHMPASQYRSVITAFPNATIIGFTATPMRLDGKGLGDYFGKIIEGKSVEWLMENGFLCRPKYYAPPTCADLSNIKKRSGDFASDQLAAAMTKPKVTGDVIAHYKKICPDARAVAFCVTIAHAEQVCMEFNAAGIKSAIISGDMAKDDRKKLVSDFGAGIVRVLVSVDVISEGFDIPAVETAILLRKTQSLGLYLQQVGRILRPAEGKQAIILDHVGNIEKHGLAEDEREWSLEGVKKSDGKKNEVSRNKQCKGCYAVYDRFKFSSCPECGFVDQVKLPEVSEGELVEIKRIEKTPLLALMKDVKTRDDLKRIAKVKGYKKGWIWHAAKELEL